MLHLISTEGQIAKFHIEIISFVRKMFTGLGLSHAFFFPNALSIISNTMHPALQRGKETYLAAFICFDTSASQFCESL